MCFYCLAAALCGRLLLGIVPAAAQRICGPDSPEACRLRRPSVYGIIGFARSIRMGERLGGRLPGYCIGVRDDDGFEKRLPEK